VIKPHDRFLRLVPPNKGMKLTKPEHSGASQLIPSVGRTKSG